MSERGPWIYHDPQGRRYLVQLVPGPPDPSLPEHERPKGLVFFEEDWICVTPVGHAFTPESLTPDEMYRVLRLARGDG